MGLTNTEWVCLGVVGAGVVYFIYEKYVQVQSPQIGIPVTNTSTQAPNTSGLIISYTPSPSLVYTHAVSANTSSPSYNDASAVSALAYGNTGIGTGVSGVNLQTSTTSL